MLTCCRMGFLIAVAWLVLAQPASAVLVGTTIQITPFGTAIAPLLPESPFLVANPGPVTPQGEDDFKVVLAGLSTELLSGDVYDTGIRLAASNTTGLVQYSPGAKLTFSGLDWGGTGSLSNVIIASSGFSGNQPDIVFLPGDTSFVLNLSEANQVADALITIALAPSHPDPAIPEPTTITLLGAGFAALIYGRRKRM